MFLVLATWGMDLLTDHPHPPLPVPKIWSPESILKSPVQVLSYGRVVYGSSHCYTPSFPVQPSTPPPSNVSPSKKIGVHRVHVTESSPGSKFWPRGVWI